jgi:hypothetical protein
LGVLCSRLCQWLDRFLHCQKIHFCQRQTLPGSLEKNLITVLKCKIVNVQRIGGFGRVFETACRAGPPKKLLLIHLPNATLRALRVFMEKNQKKLPQKISK